MISLGYLFILCMVLLLSYNKFRRFINIISIFTGIWCIFGVLSSFGLYNVRVPAIKVHLYAWLFVITVDCVWIMFAKKRRVMEYAVEPDSMVPHGRIKLVQCTALILLVPLFLRVIRMLLSDGSLALVRQMYFSGTNFSSMFQDLLFRTVPMGLLNALIIYYTYVAFESKQYRYLAYALLNTLLVTIVNGGRHALLLLLYAIVIIWTSGKVDLSDRKRLAGFRKRTKKFAGLLAVILMVITLTRGQAIIKNIYLYFSGSLAYLDYILENPASFALDRPLFGYLTFASILEPLVLVLKVLGITTAKVPSYEFNIYCQQYYNIGTNMEIILFNANTSVLYYYLRDFGVFGIIIGALALGIVTVKVYNDWQRGSRFSGVLFLYLGNALLNTIMTYQLIGPTPLIIVVSLYFLTPKRFKRGRKIKAYGEMS